MNETPSFDPQAFKDFEHAGWEEAAANYHGLFGAITVQAAEPLLDAVGTKEGVRILDVACGPAQVSAAALERGATVFGVDFSAAMVAEARRRCPDGEFRQGDAEDLPFADGSFGAVVCNFGMRHFPQPERAIIEAYRVLAPGGYYAFTDWSPPEKSPFFRVIMDAIEAHGDPSVPLTPGPDYVFGDPATCEQTLLSAGFAEPAVSELPIVARLSRAEEILDILYKSNVRSKALLDAQEPEAREKIDWAIAENARRFEKENAIEIPRPAVMASARKP